MQSRLVKGAVSEDSFPVICPISVWLIIDRYPRNMYAAKARIVLLPKP
jgi:hypothetical protein